MSYRVIAHSRSGEVAYRGTEVHGSYGAAEAEARDVARRAGLTDVHIVKNGQRIVGEVKAVGGARRNPAGPYRCVTCGALKPSKTAACPVKRSIGAREHAKAHPSGARRNPDRFAAHEIEVISWPTPWHAGHYPKMSKKDFKDYVKLNGWSAEVMCHGMRSVPGSLRDLPRTRHAVYGGTSNPNQRPAKWYATLDLTGATPKVS